MRTLIFPDIHNKTHIVDAVLQFEAGNYDHVICLGDYFDSHGDAPGMATITAKWVKDKLYNPLFTLLMGNHDQSYRYKHMKCSGWTPDKQVEVDAVLVPEDFHRMPLWMFVDGWMLSHAGMHPSIFCHPVNGFSLDYAGQLEREALIKAEMSDVHPAIGVGAARSGGMFSGVGGCTWCDFNREFEPISGLRQIFGHTPGNTVREKGNIADSSSSFCLDTALNHYAALEDGVIAFIRISDYGIIEPQVISNRT